MPGTWTRGAACAAALLLAAGAAHAQMIKCVDARGVTHYTDKPPPGCKGGAVDIRAQPPISSEAKSRDGEDLGKAERDFRKRHAERARKDDADARKQAANKRKCESLRAQEYRTRTARRVYGLDENGKYGPLDDAARARKLEELARQAAAVC